MTIYDITRTLSPQTAIWPGDSPFSITPNLSITNGDVVNLTRLNFSPHIGTHTDAYWHTAPQGGHPIDLPLEKYIGTVQVITITRQNGAILPEEVQDKVKTPVQRLLIHTRISDNPDSQFDEDFPYPSPELIDWLADHGAVLFGMDSHSMDDFNSKDLPGHRRLREREMVNLENLMLADVPDGEYELVALPLKIAGVCGSPVRAILRA